MGAFEVGKGMVACVGGREGGGIDGTNVSLLSLTSTVSQEMSQAESELEMLFTSSVMLPEL